jgi:hypothetical protein
MLPCSIHDALDWAHGSRRLAPIGAVHYHRAQFIDQIFRFPTAKASRQGDVEGERQGLAAAEVERRGEDLGPADFRVARVGDVVAEDCDAGGEGPALRGISAL